MLRPVDCLTTKEAYHDSCTLRANLLEFFSRAGRAIDGSEEASQALVRLASAAAKPLKL